MSKHFISENFLLSKPTSIRLYHKIAKDLPIIDYHCHLPVEEIATNKKFPNLTHIWLNGDHYKWRAMRANGVDEKYCTGNASDYEKFDAWAETVPFTIRNPLYHWTHMELKKPFGIDDLLLNKDTAKSVWDTCNDLLKKDEFSTRGILKQFNVKTICTTDDPTDSLKFHSQLKDENYEVKVLPTFRPDKSMAVENIQSFKVWLKKLEALSNSEITNFETYLASLKLRHDYFDRNGCRLSDHGIEQPYAEDYTEDEVKNIFQKILKEDALSTVEILKFKSCMLYEFGLMNHDKNWVQQFHLGALRNNNTRMMKNLGADTGYDSIGDFEIARPLKKLLDKLDAKNKLAKTILYNLNPADNELLATMAGNFQDGSVPGKIQFGSAWWFLDQKNGIEKQIDALSSLGLLSRFVGMLTDSRSFLSYPRHEYFRRILCDILGKDVENGLIPNDENLLKSLIEGICYKNAESYFNF